MDLPVVDLFPYPIQHAVQRTGFAGNELVITRGSGVVPIAQLAGAAVEL